MLPLSSVTQVYDALHRAKAKAGASAFYANFFPLEAKLRDWVARGDLWGEVREGTALFLRRDRDFWRLYFCAANPTALKPALAGLRELKTQQVVVDLIENETTLDDRLGTWIAAGFHPYGRLQRLTLGLAGQAVSGPTDAAPQKQKSCRNDGNLKASAAPPVVWAELRDSQAIAELLESGFDRYSGQLPASYELDAALVARQILAIKSDGALAALLFFETCGFTSTIRYWIVAAPFQSRQFGSALMRHYLAAHSAVRRFLLWVKINNQKALQKYQHFGFAPDGLLDQVLVNDQIQRLTSDL